MKRTTTLILQLCLCLEFFAVTNAYAAKKDFKGLFGSYRREKFTENEAGAGEIGVDLMLSTLLPVTPLIQSQEAVSGAKANLNYATFFNLEGAITYSLTYNWLLSVSAGYFNYDTRKKTASSSDARPTFHEFTMTSAPFLLGVRYRLSQNDIVPYVGVGVGASFVNQRGFYDSSTQERKRAFTAPTGQLVGGFEFYFAAKAGIRMELAAYFMKMTSEDWTSGAPPADLPTFNFQGNVWSVRYASGIFFIF